MLFHPSKLTLENISDQISVLPLVFYYALLFKYLGSKKKTDLKFLISIIAVQITTDVLKRFPYPQEMYDITRRPKEACNCDMLSKGGPRPLGTPGFPSGHMANITFFTLYLLKNYKLSAYQKYIVYTLIPLTAWARMYKKCHNLFQVVGGMMTCYICYKITNNLK